MSEKVNPKIQRMVNRNMSPLWGSMARGWLLKLACLVLAFAVWQGIRKNNSQKRQVADIPVTIIAGEGFAVQDQSTDVVSISFRGSLEDVQFISRDLISVEMNLSDPSSLRQTLKFSRRDVKAPSGAHAVEFDPPEITVMLDREVERALPVKAVFEDDLPEGIQLVNAICDPATVRLRGAQQTLVGLEQVRTVPVSLKERYATFNTHVDVAANGQPWTALPDRVSVSVNLEENVDTRRVEDNTVHPLTLSDDSRRIRIQPEKVAVVLRGSPDALETLTARDLILYVDCTGLTELTEYEVPVRVDVPAGIQVEKTEPSVVQVTIQTK